MTFHGADRSVNNDLRSICTSHKAIIVMKYIPCAILTAFMVLFLGFTSCDYVTMNFFCMKYGFILVILCEIYFLNVVRYNILHYITLQYNIM